MLSDAQRAMLTARLRRGRQEAPAAARIGGRPADGGHPPLSYGQEQLWFLDRFAPGKSTYNIPWGFRLAGASLDADALRRALGALVVRHEVLRTRFTADSEGRARQEINEPAPHLLEQIDLAALPENERASRLRDLAITETARPFDLAEGPLLRTWLVKLAPTEHVLFLVVHHIVFDGWSVGVLVRDLAVCYAAEVEGRAADQPPLPIQFADYAHWERERLADSTSIRADVEHWRSALADAVTLDLPTDRPRPTVEDFAGGLERLDLGSELLAGLRELSSREGTTLVVMLLAAFQVLLHRYSGQDDVVVGTLSANRARSELAPLIGYLVNTLPIRADLSGDPSFSEALARVRAATLAAYEHQDLPFGKLVEALGIDRDPSRAPVFQTLFTHVEPLLSGQVNAAGIEFEVLEPLSDPDTAKFDLGFATLVRDGGLRVEAVYATALFDAATARRMLEHYGRLLHAIVRDPSLNVSRLPLLSADELHRELVEWNDTAADVPALCIHEVFEEQVRRTPDALAAASAHESVTYAELDARANRIACHLRERGAMRETLVGVSMTPSIGRLATVLGILKSGAGYVPLDPSLPAERLAYMKSDTGMSIVLAGDDDAESSTTPVPDLGDAPVQPSNAAYVIYTSGSTGRPKGVVIEHRNVVNHALGMIERFGIGAGDKVLQFASLNFDVSVMDMFTSLLSGACAVIASADERLSPPRLAELMRVHAVTVAGLPPAVAGLLSDEGYPDLRMLMIAGEAVSAELARAWARPGLTLVNGYGPTEDTVIATLAEIDGTEPVPPIGRPVTNAQAYVLDPRLSPVPIGVLGELYLGGEGVARGYLNATELTQERFIPDPFRPHISGGRLYKTGDIVRRLPNGQIVFVGRRDGQVKIRGLRLELGEVESALLAQDGVAQALVVVAADPRTGAKHLVGYIRPEQKADSTSDLSVLTKRLATFLPTYMVPSHLVALEAFPLNASGKIDRAALPPAVPALTGQAAELGSADGGVGAVSVGGARHVEPRTELETAIVAVYAALLGREQVGIDDDFFGSGGTSLQAMQLVARVHRDLGLEIAVSTVFLAPTPRMLAASVERDLAAAGAASTAQTLVRLNHVQNTLRPFYLVHAIGGTVHPYAPLAARLIDTDAVYGFEAPGLNEGSEPAGSLDAMIALYLETSRAQHPKDRPYRLGGWSMGALVAYELARRLEAEGGVVERLVLLDPPFLFTEGSGDEGLIAARFVADAAHTLGWSLDDAPSNPRPSPSPDSPTNPSTGTDDAAPHLEWLVRHAAPDEQGPALAAVRAQINRRFAVFRAHTRMIAGYRPDTPLAAETLIVSARQSPNAAAVPAWVDLLGRQATLLELDSDHYTFLTSAPLLDQLAASIAS